MSAPYTICLYDNQYYGIGFTNHSAILAYYKSINDKLHNILERYFDCNKIDVRCFCYFISFEKIILFDSENINRYTNDKSLVVTANIDDIIDISQVTTNNLIDGNRNFFKLNLNMRQHSTSSGGEGGSNKSNEYSKCRFSSQSNNYCIPALYNGDEGGVVFSSPMDYMRLMVIYLSSSPSAKSSSNNSNNNNNNNNNNNSNNLTFPRVSEDGSDAIYVPFNRLFFHNNNKVNIFKIVNKCDLYYLSVDGDGSNVNSSYFTYSKYGVTQGPKVCASGGVADTVKDRVNKAKQILLDTNNLIGRKKEFYDIYNTIFNNIRSRRNSSLYIYGNPGLGKSVVVNKVLHSLSTTLNSHDNKNSDHSSSSSISSFENMNKVKIVKLNGNSITIPTVYHEIYEAYIFDYKDNKHDDDDNDDNDDNNSLAATHLFHSITDVIRRIETFRRNASSSSSSHKKKNHRNKSSSIAPCDYGSLLLVIDEIDRSPASFIKDIFSVTTTNDDDINNGLTVLSLCIANSICIDDITMSMQYNTSNNGSRSGSKIISFDAYTEANFIDILKEKFCGLAETSAITLIAKKCCKSGDVRELLQIASVSLATATNAIALTALIKSDHNKDDSTGNNDSSVIKPIITIKHVLQCLNNLGMGNDNRKKYTLKQISTSLRSLLVALLLYNSSQSNNITIKEMFTIYSSFCLEKGLAEANKDILISYVEQLADYSILVPSEGVMGSGIGTTGKKRKGSYLNDSYNDQTKRYFLDISIKDMLNCEGLEEMYKNALSVHQKNLEARMKEKENWDEN